MDLSNKSIVITGASGDIGFACAKRFLKTGARLFLHSYKNGAIIESFIKENKKYPITHFSCDATSEKDVARVFSELKEKRLLSSIDVLVNVAGDLIKRVPAPDLSWDFVSKTIDVNIKSAFLFTSHTLPLLNSPSSIIFVSSLTAQSGKGDRSSAYGLSKGALISWSKCLANELGPRGIRVNCVTPGFIEGSFHKKYTKKEVALEHASRNPLQRIGIPADVAEVVYFLATQTDGYVNGTTIEVCGGDYMR